MTYFRRDSIIVLILCTLFGVCSISYSQSLKTSSEQTSIKNNVDLQKEIQFLREKVKKLTEENERLRKALVEGTVTPRAKTNQVEDVSEYRLSESGVRHNKNCRYFHSKGRPCKKTEGRPCKKCGG